MAGRSLKGVFASPPPPANLVIFSPDSGERRVVPSIPLPQGSIARMCSRFAKTIPATAPPFVLHRIADHGEGFLATLVVGNDVIGALVVPLVDLFLRHKLVDIDGARALDFDRLKLFRLNLDIAATFEFLAASFVLSFNHAPRFFVDHLLAKAIAGLSIDPMEMRLFRLT